MKSFRFIILLTTIVFGNISLNAQITFRGVNTELLVKDKNAKKIIKASESYSGITIDSKKKNNDIYSLWLGQPVEYYPEMYNSWLLCVNSCPNQKNLYIDGIDMHRWMIGKTDVYQLQSTYYNTLMRVWDEYIDNAKSISSIDSEVSVNKVRMGKAYDQIMFCPDVKTGNEEMYAKLFDLYDPVINDCVNSINNKDIHNGSLTDDQLWDYFKAVTAKCQCSLIPIIPLISQYKDSLDSNQKEIESIRHATKLTTELNDKLKLLYEKRNTLNAKYKEELEENTILNARAKIEKDLLIVKSYDKIKKIHSASSPSDNKLIENCQVWLEQYAPGIDSIKTMKQLSEEYRDSIPAHANDLKWLNALVWQYRYAIDYDYNDENYKYAVECLRNCYNKSTHKKPADPVEGITVQNHGQNMKKAFEAYKKTENSKEFLVLCIYYCDKAIAAGRNKGEALMLKSRCLREIPEWLFWSGKKHGDTIKIDGLTLQIP